MSHNIQTHRPPTSHELTRKRSDLFLPPLHKHNTGTNTLLNHMLNSVPRSQHRTSTAGLKGLICIQRHNRHSPGHTSKSLTLASGRGACALPPLSPILHTFDTLKTSGRDPRAIQKRPASTANHHIPFRTRSTSHPSHAAVTSLVAFSTSRRVKALAFDQRENCREFQVACTRKAFSGGATREDPRSHVPTTTPTRQKGPGRPSVPMRDHIGLETCSAHLHWTPKSLSDPCRHRLQLRPSGRAPLFSENALQSSGTSGKQARSPPDFKDSIPSKRTRHTRHNFFDKSFSTSQIGSRQAPGSLQRPRSRRINTQRHDFLSIGPQHHDRSSLH